MINILFSILVFLFGLCIGSFLNAVIWRLETGESIVSAGVRPPLEQRGSDPRTHRALARSYCPQCKAALHWYDLVPVLSFFFLRGKCRYCGKQISIQYPLVEIATGLLFVLIINYQLSIINKFSIINYQLLISLVYYLYIASVLIIIFVYDSKHYIIPDKILFPAIGVSIIYLFLGILKFDIGNLLEINPPGSLTLLNNRNYKLEILWSPTIATLLASGFFLILVLASHGKWMGLGDAKLAVLMGLILGWPNILVALFLAFMSGAVVGIILILVSISGFRKSFGLTKSQTSGFTKPQSLRYSLKSQIPFGPFLIIGTFIALFWGQKIIEWYLDLLV